MFKRELPDVTIPDLFEAWRERQSYWSGGIHQVAVHLDVDIEEGERPVLVFGEHEVPSTDDGITALANFLKVPSKFLLRVETDEQQFILDKRIERASDDTTLSVAFTSDGVKTVRKAGSKRIDPSEIVEVAGNLVGDDAKVIDAWCTPEDLRIDVLSPEPRFRYLDAVGGLRFAQNRKQNLSPTVQPILFTDQGTTTFEVYDDGFKVDSRGAEESEILMLLEAEGRRALKRTETDQEALHDLRTQRVGDDRSGVLRRITREAGLPERTIGQLQDLLAEQASEGEATMWDLAFLIANQANNDVLKDRPGPRRVLEQVAGALVADHAARCPNCHSKIAV